MSEQIKKITQIDDPVLNNLVDTENKLNQLNQEVGVILNEYNNTNTVEVSFFNFNNSFFLLTLAGLFMLAFALWFLKQELRHSKPKKLKLKIVKHSKPEVKAKGLEQSRKVIPKIANSPEQSRRENKVIKKEEEKVATKIISKKVRKIKVIKVK